ncbi:hypothetical protein C488_00257 [Natrinema pellirubrum DSM 15624]|uniref:Uncharacterized protein n=1 Tax=Natrinema pellirubrum (strain DSM 15624 / CIP 106293 / JCM 10476 / NCIMB 786 / 157) TaxID=797303 RepID=L0JLI5_NATP1|nr:winged helix-turn-helix transcriptional regulator [Natrinema pellirubrum]AGB31437.1 hypothetical protein Natpe_1537 [Natrinema pellirubrum DSM 15624]ELY82010.1 hypothetical protein C488_00257 [Natrinema pellirubrum DSM 15624]
MSERTEAAIDTLEFVTRSPSRVRILERLDAEGSVSRDALSAEVDVVRTTLSRSLSALVDRGLIRERGQRYEITAAGALVADGVTAALERTDAAIRLRPVLERLDEEWLGVDPDRLTDATVVEATMANPYAPVTHHATTLAEADRVRAVLPAAGADPLEASTEAIENGAKFEMLLAEPVVESVRTDPTLAAAFESIVDQPSVSVSVVDRDVPVYLGVVDRAVQIGVHDDTGLPTALLESTDDRLREWAIARFDALKQGARPFDPDP